MISSMKRKPAARLTMETPAASRRPEPATPRTKASSPEPFPRATRAPTPTAMPDPDCIEKGDAVANENGKTNAEGGRDDGTVEHRNGRGWRPHRE